MPGGEFARTEKRAQKGEIARTGKRVQKGETKPGGKVLPVRLFIPMRYCRGTKPDARMRSASSRDKTPQSTMRSSTCFVRFAASSGLSSGE